MIAVFIAVMLPVLNILQVKLSTQMRRSNQRFSEIKMTENRSLTPLKLWSVSSERPSDVTQSCYVINETWFCTDDSILYCYYDPDCY